MWGDLLVSCSFFEQEVTYLQIGFGIVAGLLGAYYTFKKAGIRFRTTREVCQLSINSNELTCTPEIRRDFCRFYQGNALYIWTHNLSDPLQIKCGIKTDGGSLTDSETSELVRAFEEELKAFLPETAKNTDFTERLLPYLSTTPGISFTISLGPTMCLKQTLFVILVSEVSVRVLNVGFSYKDGVTKCSQIKILSPNLLTNPTENCIVAMCTTFPETPDSLSIITNDLKYYQEVLSTNEWNEFIETKL